MLKSEKLNGKDEKQRKDEKAKCKEKLKYKKIRRKLKLKCVKKANRNGREEKEKLERQEMKS